MKLEAQLQDAKNRLQADYEGQASLLTWQKETVQKLETAVDFAKKNYDEQVKEFSRGLVSNLEVLRSLDDYLSVKRTLDREKLNLKLAWIELGIISGKIL